MNSKAPVSDVGGVQDNGPWPADVEEIATGKAYNRPVELSDGSTETVSVTVTEIQQIVRPDGTPTDGYVVRYEYTDPTLEVNGGAL